MPAKNQSKLFEKANHFYQTKNYEKAIKLYDSIIHSGYISAPVYFNLGNAYFKLGKYPMAILHYEKAKKLAGDQEDIDFNLRFSKQFISDKIEPIPELMLFRLWNQMVNKRSSEGWAILGIIFFWITLFFFSWMILFRKIWIKKTNLAFGLLFFVLFIFTLVFSWKRAAIESRYDYAIVMTPATSVKSAPDDESKEIFIIHQGIKIQLFEKVQDWQKIRLADGKTGWIKIDDYLVI